MWFKAGARGETRYPQLDVLRGVAIVMVMFYHTRVHWREVGVMGPVCYFFQSIGWSGVDLFFVLSGFLIGGLLFREIQRDGKLDVRRFMVRRAFKIWPPYFVLIGYAFLKLIYRGSDLSDALWRIMPNLIHLQNYSWQVAPHTWSLAVEEHFYLALPLLLWMALRVRRGDAANGIDVVPIVACMLAVLCLGLRCYRALWLKNRGNPVFPTELRIDSLFFGVLCGYAYHYRPDLVERGRRFKGALLVAGLVLLSPALFTPDLFRDTFGFTCTYLGYGAILLSVMCADENSRGAWKLLFGRTGKFLGFIGAFSYGIYLWHMDLASALAVHLYQLKWQKIEGAFLYCAFLATYLVIAVAIGVVMTLLVERPSLWIRDRWWPSRARAKAPDAAELALSGECATTTT